MNWNIDFERVGSNSIFTYGVCNVQSAVAKSALALFDGLTAMLMH